ncbi:DNA-binding transcriptional LysR family regulator [Parvibaculum sp. MBR-TMA-1.3b-4.2]|jgi:DNA-binding transcriptional LysR family regulator
MNLRNIDLNLLTIFEAIMVERSITRAAARLNMTQPALSNALSRLRALVNDPLFVRQGNEIAPTARARAMDAPVRRALKLARHAFQERHPFHPGEIMRRFSLFLGDLGETLYLPRIMPRLRLQAAAASIALKQPSDDTLIQDVKKERLDLAWLSIPPDDKSVCNEALLHDEFVCVTAAATIAGRILDETTFFNLTHVRLAARHAPGHIGEHAFRRKGKARRVVAEVDTLHAMAFLAASSDIAGCMPRMLAERYAALLGLRVDKMPFEVPPAFVHQAWPAILDDDPDHIWLRTLIREAVTGG